MSDAAASILPRKIENAGPPRAKSGFTPDMLHAFCDLASEALGELLDARVKVTLDSIGLEPMGDVVSDSDEKVCGGVIDMNGMRHAATLIPDTDALFHIVDIMLGGNPAKNEPVIGRPASSLSDQFCKKTIDTMMHALVKTCDAAIAPGACAFGGQISIVHDRELLLIAPPKADIMAIEMSVAFGKAGRTGRFLIHLPLKTVDAISGPIPGGAAQPAYESGPWFEHMKSNVALMELETMALVHTESMTLAALSRLDIGDVLPIDRDAVTSVRIVLEDGGDLIASGELGTSSGKRVISLDDVPNEAFLEPLRKLLDEI